MRERLLPFLLLVILLPVAAGENLLRNPGFEVWSPSAPHGWHLHTWKHTGGVVLTRSENAHSGKYAAVLTATVPEDGKLVQKVQVEPDSLYRFSVWVKVEGVPSDMLGANLSALETTERSPDVKDTRGEWVLLETYCRTGATQREVNLTLRLGGYGALSTGTVWFDDAEFVKVERAPAGARIIGLAPTTPSTPRFPLGLHLLLTLAYLGLLALLLRTPLLSRIPLPALLLAALLLRLALAPLFPGHSSDMPTFYAWATELAREGIPHFYATASFKDYPPGYLLVLYPVGLLITLFRIPFGHPASLLLLKLPSIAADLLAALVLLRAFPTRLAIPLTAAYLFNPSIILNSAVYGQADSVLTLVLLLFLVAFHRRSYTTSAAWLGLALAVKPQALLFAPIALLFLLTWLIRPLTSRTRPDALASFRRLAPTMGLSLLSFAGTLLLVHLPFFILHPQLAPTLYHRILTSYPFGSVNAANFWTLAGFNWKPLLSSFLGTPLSTWQTIVQTALLAGAAFIYLREEHRTPSTIPFLTALFLALWGFAFLPKMHERYIYPALILSLAAFLTTERRTFLIVFLLLTVSSYLNQAHVLFHAAQKQFQLPLDAPMALASLLTLTAAALLIFGLFPSLTLPLRRLILRRPAPPPLLPSHEEHTTPRHLILLGLITLAYALIAFTNLGSLDTPTTFYKPRERTEYFVVELPPDRVPRTILYYRGLGTGTYDILSSPDRKSWKNLTVIENTNPYAEFGWFSAPLPAPEGPYLLFRVHTPGLALHEIAFLDRDGTPIPVKIPTYFSSAKSMGNPDLLVDEQETIPERISHLTNMYFDEIYHARTAYEYVLGLPPSETTHPPLGKLIISLGILLFGMTPFGWRFAGTLIGVLMIPLFYLLARTLLRKPSLALLAALLLSVEHLHFVQTRIATIDSFAVFFIILMYIPMVRYVLLLDEEAFSFRRFALPLLLSGLFFGLGAATKWTCVYAGGGLAVLYLWKLVRALKTGEGTPSRIAGLLLWSAASFLVLPALIYGASYIPNIRILSISSPVSYILKEQVGMYRYHSELTATHPFSSPWWQWPLLIKPIWYYSGKSHLPSDVVSSIFAMGNPLIIWGGTAALLWLLVRWVRTRSRLTGLLLLLFGFQYLPWAISPRSLTFFYHYFAAIPFSILLLVHAAEELGLFQTQGKTRWIVPAFAAGCAILFLLFYPILSGLPVPRWYAVLLRWMPTWYFY
ncbi:glycosyl transferase family 39 [Spirochaeta thermophila DSM 6578]|uniref:Polyprenol-phosphate-mannose--protein mannosyltransferase n=1 Tax=Winmispira thermophila (strain ATCC 700085 / DSM 6578 / Z-1203) TaxID=869211 RepID=G0GCM9_WINT7|nr:phospholipid carrier-dependent glycosyltransferase [Spirochaeta thermophila]AEJ62095.1 glycosyl transferase family 39 [Spirochaeta thermophila DSM 6578]